MRASSSLGTRGEEKTTSRLLRRQKPKTSSMPSVGWARVSSIQLIHPLIHSFTQHSWLLVILWDLPAITSPRRLSRINAHPAPGTALFFLVALINHIKVIILKPLKHNSLN